MQRSQNPVDKLDDPSPLLDLLMSMLMAWAAGIWTEALDIIILHLPAASSIERQKSRVRFVQTVIVLYFQSDEIRSPNFA